jgi:hypothetical protein
MKLHLILSPVLMDDILHKFDLFEGFKKLVTMETVEVEIKDKANVNDLLLNIRDKINSLGSYNVVALFLPDIKGAGWYDERVKVISTGKKWTLLRVALMNLNYPCEIREMESKS